MDLTIKHNINVEAYCLRLILYVCLRVVVRFVLCFDGYFNYCYGIYTLKYINSLPALICLGEGGL